MAVVCYDARNREIIEGENKVLFGHFVNHIEGKDVFDLKQLQTVEEINDFFRKSVGDFALIYQTPIGLAVTTTSFFDVYYTIKEDSIYLSDDLKELEDKYTNVQFINYDMVFYYVVSGNYPPFNFTFFTNILKVCGDHTCQFKDLTVWKNENYNAIFEKGGNKRNEYKKILDYEVKSWEKTIEQRRQTPYITISGVDSFNVFLAYSNDAYVIHKNVNKTQSAYVNQFVDTTKSRGYFTEIDKTNDELSSIPEIIENYREFLMPYLKYSTNDSLYRYIKQVGGQTVLTGDLTGLTMAFKSFTSTIEQHSFFGRYLLGAKRRLNYLDRKISKMNKKSINPKEDITDLYYFMVSSFVPTSSFNNIRPLKGCKKIDGLTEKEKDCYFKILDDCISQFEKSTKWDRRKVTDRAPFLFRVFKKQMYSAGFPCVRSSYKERYGLELINIFSSTIATRFLYNYKATMREVFQCKKIVYDYFFDKTGVKMKSIGKKARKNCSPKVKIKEFCLFVITYIPYSVKNTHLYKKLKNKLIQQVMDRDSIGKMNISSLEKELELRLFSKSATNEILKSYFEQIETQISVSDFSYMPYSAERYLNLILYIDKRIKNSKYSTNC